MCSYAGVVGWVWFAGGCGCDGFWVCVAAFDVWVAAFWCVGGRISFVARPWYHHGNALDFGDTVRQRARVAEPGCWQRNTYIHNVTGRHILCGFH